MNRPGSRERRLAVITIVLAVAFAFILGEVALRVFFEPYRVSTIGHPDTENAALYGWGFYPGERFALRNPDTGEVYPSRVNAHGWRDEEHVFENPTGAFRILVLGDSNTFGPTVPQDKIYPRILEDRLRAAGYHAEVISIAYGAWGTDQKLEALTHEGLRYKPDLVLLQYTANDVKFISDRDPQSLGAKKPFVYRLGDDGKLVRDTNPALKNDGWMGAGAHKQLKRWLMHSEVLARLYGLYTMSQHIFTPARERYVVGAGQVQRIQQLLGLDAGHALLRYLVAQEGKPIPAAALADAIRGAALTDHAELILRICENQWFNQGDPAATLEVAAPDTHGADWRLFFALLDEIRDRARAAGAELALFADIDESGYEWAVYWGLTRDTPVNRVNYLAPRVAVETYARSMGMDHVPNALPHVRSRNDPHQNVEGTTAMAEEIYRYLVARYGDRMRAAH